MLKRTWVGGVMVAGLLLSAAGAAGQVREPEILREGEGAHRSALNQSELKKFDAGAWAKLSDWTNGAALTAGATTGKPVLIVTWADYVPTAKRGLQLARRMAEKFGPQGLIVVGVHTKQEWAAAEKPAAPKDAMFLLAQDAKAEFRAALDADNDPDFFVIDRAGQMRFADIATESVEKAAELVTKETAEGAAGIQGTLAAQSAARDADVRRTSALRSKVDLTNLPEVEFAQPEDDVYKRAPWATRPRDPNNQNQDQGPSKLTIPDQGFVSAKPETKGRVVLVYLWDPNVHESYKDMGKMDLLQTQHGRNLAVIGAMTRLTESRQEEQQQRDPEAVIRTVQSFVRARNLHHAIMVDPTGAMLAATGQNGSVRDIAFPYVIVASSDGMIRGFGPLDDPGVKAALDTALRVDPGVKARQKAEDEYIRTKSK